MNLGYGNPAYGYSTTPKPRNSTTLRSLAGGQAVHSASMLLRRETQQGVQDFLADLPGIFSAPIIFPSVESQLITSLLGPPPGRGDPDTGRSS